MVVEVVVFVGVDGEYGFVFGVVLFFLDVGFEVVVVFDFGDYLVDW